MLEVDEDSGRNDFWVKDGRRQGEMGCLVIFKVPWTSLKQDALTRGIVRLVLERMVSRGCLRLMRIAGETISG